MCVLRCWKQAVESPVLSVIKFIFPKIHHFWKLIFFRYRLPYAYTYLDENWFFPGFGSSVLPSQHIRYHSNSWNHRNVPAFFCNDSLPLLWPSGPTGLPGQGWLLILNFPLLPVLSSWFMKTYLTLQYLRLHLLRILLLDRVGHADYSTKWEIPSWLLWGKKYTTL